MPYAIRWYDEEDKYEGQGDFCFTERSKAQEYCDALNEKWANRIRHWVVESA